jgi:hypothetical protein
MSTLCDSRPQSEVRSPQPILVAALLATCALAACDRIVTNPSAGGERASARGTGSSLSETTLAPAPSYEADVLVVQSGDGPSVKSEYHVSAVSDESGASLRLRPKGLSEDKYMVIRRLANGQRVVDLSGLGLKTNGDALRHSDNVTVRRLMAFLDGAMPLSTKDGASANGPVQFASRTSTSWAPQGRSLGTEVARQGSVITYRRETVGGRQTVSVDTSIGVPTFRLVERPDGSRVQMSQEFAPLTPELSARTSAAIQIRQPDGSHRAVTLTVTNIQLSKGGAR